MTHASENEDEHWLKALAGNPDPGGDPKINLQAESLRRALQARKRLLDTEVPIADAGPYQEILFRLRRENFSNSEQPDYGAMAAASVWRGARQYRLENDEDLQAKTATNRGSWLDYKITWGSPLLWALVAAIVLAVWFALT